MKYRFNDGVYINFNDPEMYKHFCAIRKKLNRYKLFKIALDNLSVIYLDEWNNIKSSYFDSEENAMHLLKSQLNIYTVAHELGHKLQDLTDEFVDLTHNYEYEISQDSIEKHLFRVFEQRTGDVENKEFNVAILDIINSWSKGSCANIFNHKSHSMAYFDSDEELSMMECLSDYLVLTICKNKQEEFKELKHEFKEIFKVLKKLTKEIQERVQELSLA